ncbi:NADH oxidase [Xylariaceae sp. FL0662B]|nr:NADH oxidase [Xylariaceae sp. FL0662B]
MPTRYEGRDVDAAPLREPLHLPFSRLVAPNRLLKAAMTERLASWDAADMSASGIPTESLLNLYGHWGQGGWGIIVTGNILVDATHLEAPGNMIVAAGAPRSGPRFEAFARLARAAKAGGSLFLGQLNHPGRQTERALQPDPVSASDVQLTRDLGGLRFARPHAASADEIRDIKAAFVHAAAYLEAAGFDGVQLHGAHGYLLAQFLSPTTNRRTDRYGGALENRARLVTELGDAVRAATGPDFVLAVKINSVEFQDAGFTTADAAALVRLLEEHGFDLVELSGGTYEAMGLHHRKQSTVRREAFFLDFAELIVPHVTRTRCFITGGIRTVGAMVDALKSGLDGVGLGRPSTTEPRLPMELLVKGRKACIKPLIGDANVLAGEESFGFGAVLSGAHMRQIGLNQEPLDPSNQESIDGFLKDFATWSEELPNRSRKEVHSHVKIQSVEVNPYGAVV